MCTDAGIVIVIRYLLLDAVHHYHNIITVRCSSLLLLIQQIVFARPCSCRFWYDDFSKFTVWCHGRILRLDQGRGRMLQIIWLAECAFDKEIPCADPIQLCPLVSL